MFEKYSSEAKMALFYARNFAEEFKSEVVMPEHLLMGIVNEGEEILRDLIPGIKELKKELEISLKRERQNKMVVFEKTNIILGDSTKQILASALHISQNLKSDKVGLEHLLIAILRSSSFSSYLLKSYGVSTFKLRKYIQEREKEKELKAPPCLLETFGINLNRWVQRGKCFPYVGREKELERMINILGRFTKNNVLLIGEAGVGKTALVEALSRKISEENVPPFLKNMQIYAIDMGQLISGTKYRGQFEERLKGIIKEASENEKIILFIDEIHTIIGAGSSEGSLDAANLLKPPLSRGQIRCIGATTLKDYKKYLEKDKALMRRFQTIILSPPTEEETLKILQKLKNQMENFHNVYFPDETLKAIVHYSNQYIPGRVFPDKAIDIMDEVAAKVKIKGMEPTPSEAMLLDELKEISEKIKEALDKKDFERAFGLKNQEVEIKEALKILKERVPNTPKFVSVKDVEDVISTISGIPISFFFANDKERFNKLKERLKEEILEQSEAINKILEILKTSFSLKEKRVKPKPLVLLCGPSGTGKSQMANIIAEEILPNSGSFYKVEMSEYMEKHMVSKLLGSPPGYVGYEEGGTLTEFVKRNPFGLLLFENIDKAHKDILNLFSQILEKGTLEDASGELINFKNTMIFITMTISLQKKGLGFETQKSIQKKNWEKEAREEIKKVFPENILNKIDSLIFFYPFDFTQLKNILKIKLGKILKEVKEEGVEVHIKKEVLDFLMKKLESSYENGVYAVENILKNSFKDPLKSLIFSMEFPSKLEANLSDENIIFLKEESYALNN